MAKSRHTSSKATNWEWVDESKEVIESVKAPHDLSSFNFVSENGVSRPRGEKPRKLIRAHATRHGRAQHSSSSTASTSSTLLNPKSQSRLQPHTQQILRVKPSPKPPSLLHRFPKSSSLDPFRTLPGGETSETSLLLDFYTQFKEFEPFKPLPGAPTPETNPLLGDWISLQSDSDLAVSKTATWLSFSKAEPPLFHVTLLLAGIRMFSCINSPAVRVALLYQRGEAIKGVREYLKEHKNSRDENVAWTIVCTVAALAQADSALSLNSSAMEHLNGLELLVQARGGLHTFENVWNGRARSYIEWTDLNASLLMETKPRFVHSKTSTVILTEIETSSAIGNSDTSSASSETSPESTGSSASP